ncbi:MAG TPA: DUF222 domain-containing protein [Gryllotalpicola sp.]
MAVTGSAASGALSRLAGLLPVEVCGLSDQQLVSFAGQLSAARRQVESLELAVAAEFGRRSNGAARGESLANRLGVRTAAQAVEAVTGSSASAAQRLVKDAEVFATLPAVEEAVLAGRIGRESAQAIAGELMKTTSSVDAAQLAQAGRELVALAQTQSVDRVREEAQRKTAALTPQFVEDRAKTAMADRFLWIGPVRNGAAKVSGLLPAGHAAVITGLFDAYANPRATVRFASSDEDDEQPRDARSAGQKRADLFRDVCAAQARSAHAPELGGDHPTVWVSTTARELSTGAGMAFYAGVSEPVPVTDAEQAACTGGIQTVVFDDDGRVLRLGRRARGFTRRQRRAIALRDGGSCLIPGCTTPAQWCETHHVTPWSGGGETDVDNGTRCKSVRLCRRGVAHGRARVQSSPLALRYDRHSCHARVAGLARVAACAP